MATKLSVGMHTYVTPALERLSTSLDQPQLRNEMSLGCSYIAGLYLQIKDTKLSRVTTLHPSVIKEGNNVIIILMELKTFLELNLTLTFCKLTVRKLFLTFF